jgi:signal transduction histidine kinase
VRCKFDSPAPVAISDPQVAGHLYRIAQEAVNNAIKHAQAENVTIRLARTEGALLLEIADDGTGLPKGRRTARAGVGMGVMQHRANAIGAELTIASRRGEGVTIRCRLPLQP